MEENKLRQLERQYKLRVKTGCETCRIRRVKCDETKPECQRCTKTGRKCEGYKHSRSRNQSPLAAASFRNSSFLVVPQPPTQPSIPINPTRSLSPEAAENRSFFYFQTHTLPKWTEFFDSDLWSQKILQLSHYEPAIKHGILALSTMHERFESTTPIFSTKTSDFAFVQYMQAVKHSNRLLSSHQQGKADLETVLIACIIFTCYENLAGNYRAANMHLQNGLRILNQHKREMSPFLHQSTASEDSIANVLYRFDLQAMTFSDNTSPYDYSMDAPPESPRIANLYTNNEQARNDLVGILRCMLWISGVANINRLAPHHPTWIQTYSDLMIAFDDWGHSFEHYQQNIPAHEQGDPKIYAGNTLLKIYHIMARTIVNAGGGNRTEMAWDAFTDSFKTIVDLAETLPSLNRPESGRSSPMSTSSPPSSVSGTPVPPSNKHRTIAPNPATPTPPTQSGPSTSLFSADPSPPPFSSHSKRDSINSTTKSRPSSFSPSFELSPIVPLFVTACRCRDPILRRRAIALLLNCRRREGVWDSFGAGMVAIQCVRIEEGINEIAELGPDNWLPLKNKSSSKERDRDKEEVFIPEGKRVNDVFVSVNMTERQIGVNYFMGNGQNLDRYVKF